MEDGLAILTSERLKKYVRYDERTGVFVRIAGGGGRSRVGQILGCPNSKGYNRIMIEGVSYLSHRLAWLYVYGAWPDDEVDHINGNPLDNRIENLRAATRAQNCRNTRISTANKSGLKGVSFNRDMQKWVANIHVDRKCIYLGQYVDKDAAHAAYVAASHRYHGEFARAA